MAYQEGELWRRADGAELVAFRDYTGTLAFYTPDNHFVGVKSEREVRELGYARITEIAERRKGGEW